MKLYSRKQLEEDLQMIESLRAQLNRAVLEKRITGLSSVQKTKELDALEKKLRTKLTMTMLILRDGEAERRNKIVVKEEGGQIYRRSQGEWKVTCEEELGYLTRKTGQELHVVQGRKGQATDVLVEKEPELRWLKVPRKLARKAAADGHTVRFGQGEDDCEVLG